MCPLGRLKKGRRHAVYNGCDDKYRYNIVIVYFYTKALRRSIRYETIRDSTPQAPLPRSPNTHDFWRVQREIESMFCVCRTYPVRKGYVRSPLERRP